LRAATAIVEFLQERKIEANFAQIVFSLVLEVNAQMFECRQTVDEIEQPGHVFGIEPNFE